MDWHTIDSCIEKKSLLQHTFYQAWSQGQLTLQDLQFYAGQYYALESSFPVFLSRIHSSCETPSIRQSILENLNDEELGAENHRELWLRFAEAVGCIREQVMSSPRHAKTQECINTLKKLAAHPDPRIGLAMLYAYESQLPAVSQSKIDGLKRFYGITEPRGLCFFEVHKEIDSWHCQQERDMINELGGLGEDIKHAVETTCDALLGFLDGVDASTRQLRVSGHACCV